MEKNAKPDSGKQKKKKSKRKRRHKDRICGDSLIVEEAPVSEISPRITAKLDSSDESHPNKNVDGKSLDENTEHAAASTKAGSIIPINGVVRSCESEINDSLRWNHHLTDSDEEKQRIDNYKVKRRERYKTLAAGQCTVVAARRCNKTADVRMPHIYSSNSSNLPSYRVSSTMSKVPTATC